MNNTLESNFTLPTTANYIHQGAGRPVILIHGIAASLHDWDDLTPELIQNGYASYAVDLLGHGDSPKPASRAYQMEWIFEHFLHWMKSLHLTEPAILIGHSLGGYIALEYARRVSAWTRGLVLVNPFYSRSQLPFLLRNISNRTNLSGPVVGKIPERFVRLFVDVSSVATGHSIGAIHSLPERIRAQTALDYKRTAAGVYNIPGNIPDITEALPEINTPALVIWGDRDQTLSPASFPRLVSALPKAKGDSLRAGHAPHQSNSAAFNQRVMQFLRGLA
jgi:pimeloyl-ACP methyl ester carboxylesterase